MEKAEEFLSRVMERIPNLPTDKFGSESWRYDGRPTSEGVGLKPVDGVDVDKLARCILNVEAYPDNVQYVEHTEVISRNSDTDVLYIQRMKLPALGGIQVALHLADLGERDGWRVVAWEQDDERTMALDKKQGARTEYNLGAWLIKPDGVAYSLSAAPIKKDIGSIKYALMTKGGDATVGTVLKTNIDGMVAWGEKA